MFLDIQQICLSKEQSAAMSLYFKQVKILRFESISDFPFVIVVMSLYYIMTVAFVGESIVEAADGVPYR